MLEVVKFNGLLLEFKICPVEALFPSFSFIFIFPIQICSKRGFCIPVPNFCVFIYVPRVRVWDVHTCVEGEIKARCLSLSLSTFLFGTGSR